MNREVAISQLTSTSDDPDQYDLLRAHVAADPAAALAEGERLLAADDPQLRELGANVLGLLVQPPTQSPQLGDIVDLLIGRLPEEPNAAVRQALLAAIGHSRDSRARSVVLGFVDDEDVEVRLSVAWAIPSLGLDDRSVAALHRLSADVDEDVRDWATFGLAESDADDADTIAALIARSDDPHNDTRAEAIMGLARRHDPRARALVDRELALPSFGSMIEDARDELDRPTGTKPRDATFKVERG